MLRRVTVCHEAAIGRPRLRDPGRQLRYAATTCTHSRNWSYTAKGMGQDANDEIMGALPPQLKVGIELLSTTAIRLIHRIPKLPFEHACPSASNEMADFQLDDLPTYQIWRSAPLDDSFDLTAGLNFYPPKGSIELDEALKFWSPLSQSPQERRRDAVIAFLNEEKAADASSDDNGFLPSAGLDNGTQVSTFPNTSLHSHELGSHQSLPTGPIYGHVYTIHHDIKKRPIGHPPTSHSLGELFELHAKYMGHTPPLLQTQREYSCFSTNAIQSRPPLDPASHTTRRARFIRAGYQCTYEGCYKTFNRACDPRHHARMHIATHERPFACAECGKRFLYNKDLLRHLGQKGHFDQQALVCSETSTHHNLGLLVASGHWPFWENRTLLIHIPHLVLWTVESVVLLLCFVSGILHPRSIEILSKAIMMYARTSV